MLSASKSLIRPALTGGRRRIIVSAIRGLHHTSGIQSALVSRCNGFQKSFSYPPTPFSAVQAYNLSRPALHSGLRFLSTENSSVRASAYSWIDAEAEELIAKAYCRHKALADRSESFPPSLSVKELERIGVPYSRAPEDFVDRLSLNLMKFLRTFVHAFFREKYDHHAVCLETVAAVPGMVAAFHRHMRSLRRMSRDHGWIGSLSEEAENERMHLLIFLKVTNPTVLERSLVLASQGIYLSFYSVLYFFLPRAAHRLTGYLEEEAHRAYTDYLKCIDEGKIENKPAPEIARQYYRLPDNATMRDVVLHVRADEAAHRDFNHHLSDKYKSGDVDSAPTFLDVNANGENNKPQVEFKEAFYIDMPKEENKKAA